jgi:hypothetical protein
MDLTDFLHKWEGERNLTPLITAWFDRDPRTIRLWKRKTPRYVRFVLSLVDREWEKRGGRDDLIFFEF